MVTDQINLMHHFIKANNFTDYSFYSKHQTNLKEGE